MKAKITCYNETDVCHSAMRSSAFFYLFEELDQALFDKSIIFVSFTPRVTVMMVIVSLVLIMVTSMNACISEQCTH